MKILITDDREEDLYLLETLLKESGYEVVSAKNGVEAIELLKKNSIDMIISDILMPKMDGYQLCRECKSDYTLRKIAFVFYTATYTDKKDEEFALSLGAEKFIVKPTDPDVFLKILKSVIKEYRKGLLVAPKRSVEEETVYLAMYNKRLIEKLEKKMLDMEKEITERKRAEKKLLDYQVQLKSLASQLTLTEEHERRRIAQGLHDNIVQKLVLTKFTLQSLMESESDSNILKSLDKVCAEIDHIVEETHSLTFELSNLVLHELGLVAALEKYLSEEIQQRYGIAFELEADEQFSCLNEDIRTCLFRSVRELLINVVKHAHARKVKASIRQSGNQIRLSVEDDGVGFDPAEILSIPSRKGGFGLFSVQELLEELGGHLEIKSELGHGSKVTMITPLNRKQQSKC